MSNAIFSKNNTVKERLSIIALFIMLILCCPELSATHIIGGNMTYEFVRATNDGNLYRFRLRIYRDCSSQNSNNTQFDGLGGNDTQGAIVTIYEGDSNSSTLFSSGSVGLPTVTEIEIEEDGCMEIPDRLRQPCLVEEGIYQFDRILPVSSESYFVSYQRCCRNPDTVNINDARNSGGTYTVEITPEAQVRENSSPVFNSFPPIIVCAGFDINFDHAASDVNGDSLAYEFCAPFLGGGPLTGPNEINTPNGARPNPATPPPYNSVSFRAPTYTSRRPMAGNPTIAIDPVTGLISGVPEVLGQFAVGVCVKEYREGILLSTIRRDFQFQVVDCRPLVDAKIQSDDVDVAGQEYIINSCGNNTITFINESGLVDKIDEYKWLFDIKGDQFEKIETTRNDLTINFPDTGIYTGLIIANPGKVCSDTGHIRVSIFPEINADFSFVYDTCVAGPVAFTDLSESKAGPIQEWEWDFKDGNFSAEQNPNYVYPIPGNFDVTLQVTDQNSCVDTISKSVNYQPAPAIIVIDPSSFNGCQPLDVFFNNLSTPIDSTYTILWDFGNGDTSTEISPNYTYEDIGFYDVSLSITSPIGCSISDFFPNLITVRGSPTADFSYSPEILSQFNNEVFFRDESEEAISWYWDFGDGTFSTQIDPVHTFRDTGYYEVKQIVTHQSGCQDTLIQYLDIQPRVTYYVPNAFTPNGDDMNDGFKGKGILDGITDFQMTIWNRWGELIFETSDPTQAWNGRKNNQGNVLQNGVYVYRISFLGPRGAERELKGFATLVK